jgi:hypothetical protein
VFGLVEMRPGQKKPWKTAPRGNTLASGKQAALASSYALNAGTSPKSTLYVKNKIRLHSVSDDAEPLRVRTRPGLGPSTHLQECPPLGWHNKRQVARYQASARGIGPEHFDRLLGPIRKQEVDRRAFVRRCRAE